MRMTCHECISMYVYMGRLDMDYVDLYLMHSPEGGKVLETWDTMIQLKEQGLTRQMFIQTHIFSAIFCYYNGWFRTIGVANFNASHLKHLKEARPGHVPVGNDEFFTNDT